MKVCNSYAAFMENNKKRYYALDDIRGLTFISMLLYHGMWDLVFIAGKNIDWYRGSWGYVWQQSIGWTFILLSGFCWQLGKHKLKRGLTVFGGGLIVTLVTLLFMPEDRVVFGVLTFMGSAMLIMIPLDKILNRCNCYIGAICSFILFLITRNVNSGWLGFEKLQLVKLPDALYTNIITTYLGFPNRGFFSTDYYAVFPWLFLFITGYFLFSIVDKADKLDIFSKRIIPGAGFIGKYSLLIYMIHQPIIYGLIVLIYF